MSSESRSVVEARARADKARARLAATFDALIDAGENLLESLTPHNLARDAWEAAKSKGADLAEDAVDAVSKRPIAATGVIAALALFFAREPLMDLAEKVVGGKQGSKSRKSPKKEMETT